MCALNVVKGMELLMNLEKTGKLISKLRKEKNLTQAELENIIHVDRRTISKWENGKLTPDASVLINLSKALDITVEELLEGKINNKINSRIPKNNKYKKFLLPVICLFISIVSTLVGILILISKIDEYTIYSISSELEDFQLSGEIRYNKSNCSIRINHLLYTDIYIGTDKEINTSKLSIALIDGDRTLTVETFEEKEKKDINYYLENISLEYDDKNFETKIQNPKNIILNIAYFNSKNEQQFISTKLIFN